MAACGALETLASVNSPFTPAFAKTVADVCMACKKECDKYPQIVECTTAGRVQGLRGRMSQDDGLTEGERLRAARNAIARRARRSALRIDALAGRAST